MKSCGFPHEVLQRPRATGTWRRIVVRLKEGLFGDLSTALSCITIGLIACDRARLDDCTHSSGWLRYSPSNGNDDFTSRVSLLKIPDSLRHVAHPRAVVDNGCDGSSRH